MLFFYFKQCKEKDTLEFLNSDDDIYVFIKSQCNTRGSEIVLSNFKNRDQNRKEFEQSLGMYTVSPFEHEQQFKVYNLSKCSQIMYINTT